MTQRKKYLRELMTVWAKWALFKGDDTECWYVLLVAYNPAFVSIDITTDFA